MNPPARLLAGLPQRGQEEPTSLVRDKCGLPVIPATHRVVNRAGILDSLAARHGATVAESGNQSTEKSVFCGLTPLPGNQSTEKSVFCGLTPLPRAEAADRFVPDVGGSLTAFHPGQIHHLALAERADSAYLGALVDPYWQDRDKATRWALWTAPGP